jgi:hypothetical protein
MAIGLARMFGIKFPHNFDSPYKAGSIIVFWERWHRTLTRFLREYVYFSLGGNRRGLPRQIFNIMITMLLSGLWHGAGWTFVIWGVLHGTFLVINHTWRLIVKQKEWKLDHWAYRGAGVVVTFVVVSLAWVLFRAPNLGVTDAVLANMLPLHGFSVPSEFIVPTSHFGHMLAKLGFHFVDTDALDVKHYDNALYTCAFLLAICWFMPNSQQMLEKYHPILEPVTRPGLFRISLGFFLGLVFGFLLFLILRNSFVAEPSPFIYFNF